MAGWILIIEECYIYLLTINPTPSLTELQPSLPLNNYYICVVKKLR